MNTPFEGFIRPTRNWFSMPNNWTDITSEIDNLAELKVVEYVARHTWGFHEFGIKKTISTDEFMHGRRRADGSRMDKGTGLKSDRSVRDGLKLAIEHGYLEDEVDNSDQGRIKKSYALKMTSPREEEVGGYDLPLVDTTTPTEEGNRVVANDTQGGSIYQSGVQHLPVRGATSTDRSEKETLERNFRKKPKKDSDGAACADTTPRTPSQAKSLKENTDATIDATLPTGSQYPGGTLHLSDSHPPCAPLDQDRTSPAQRARSAKGTTDRSGKAVAVAPPLTLSEQEQAFYDLYCSMPWIKVAPPITEKVKEQCGKLAPHLTTQEQMFTLRKFMNGREFFKGKFSLTLVAMALNDFAMTQEDVQEARKPAPPPVSDEERAEKLRRADAAFARLQASSAAHAVGMGV